MKSLTECFIDIVKKQKEYGYPFPSLLLPPATEEELTEAEKKIGFQFNEDLKELYRFSKGAEIKVSYKLGLIDLIPSYEFIRLKESLKYPENYNGYEDSFRNWQTEFQPGRNMFPFLTDGAGNYYWVDLNEDHVNYGKIYWTNTLQEDPDYLFNSLTNMFNVIRNAYYEGIIYVGGFGYLEQDYKLFGLLAQKNNSDLTYWDRYCKE
jgi:cell wall assembly regulator SMI1